MNTWWQEVWLTLQDEFADIGDARQLTQITLRLLVAALLGAFWASNASIRARPPGFAPICWWPWARLCSCWCRACPGPRPMP
ncbi:hypothetical protein PBOI14_36370 [Pseudomonas sp. Boi14]|nr:hypothetical protein PBOI14_36370 [Pseudomonas sp. Boi14]